MFECTLWRGGKWEEGGCSIARNVRTAAACVCVCDTDGCANGKTDRCLGGSNGMQWWSGAHSRGEIRAKTSSIGGESPITKPLPPSPVSGVGTDPVFYPRSGGGADRSDSLGGGKKKKRSGFSGY